MGYVNVNGTATISNAYAIGNVTASSYAVAYSYAGGLVSYIKLSSYIIRIEASYWDKVATGQLVGTNTRRTIGKGYTYINDSVNYGLTIAQLKDTAYFMSIAGAEGGDFENVWAPPGDDYMPEFYALSKVICAHADGSATAQYG